MEILNRLLRWFKYHKEPPTKENTEIIPVSEYVDTRKIIRRTETDDWIVEVFADGSSNMIQKRNPNTELTARAIFETRFRANTARTNAEHEKKRLEEISKLK